MTSPILLRQLCTGHTFKLSPESTNVYRVLRQSVNSTRVENEQGNRFSFQNRTVYV